MCSDALRCDCGTRRKGLPLVIHCGKAMGAEPIIGCCRNSDTAYFSRLTSLRAASPSVGLVAYALTSIY